MRISSRVNMLVYAERDIVMADRSVCLSVCLSVCHTLTNVHIVKLFSPSGSMTSFMSVTAVTKFQGSSLSGGVKQAGWENLRFSTEVAVYLGNGIRNRSILQRNTNRKS